MQTLREKSEKSDDENKAWLQRNSYCMNFNSMRKNNYHCELSSGIQPYFDNLEERLVSLIEKSTYVIGCVAWLTNPNILEALLNTSGAKIIVNKEEYLNPNMEKSQKFFYQCLRGKYNEIPDLFAVNCKCCGVTMKKCPNFIKTFGDVPNADVIANSIGNDQRDGAILACGIVNNFSKMHHKFLVFFNENVEPFGLWTGSYNFSRTSNFSLENALYISDRDVIMEYIKEFLVIYPFSESYKWKSGALCKAIK